MVESGSEPKVPPPRATAVVGLTTAAIAVLAVKFEWCSKLCMFLMPYRVFNASEYILAAVIAGLGSVGICVIRQRHLLGLLSEKAAEQRAAHALARTDFLTGLPNRLSLSEYIAKLDQTVAGGVAALVLDLDNFKTINDTMGHAAGDEVLKSIAARLVALMDRYQHTITFRLGGDEFLIMILEASTNVDLLRDIIRETISEPVLLPCGSITVSSSIGTAHADSSNTHFTNIMAAADLAMFRNKRAAKKHSNISTLVWSPIPRIEYS